MYYNDIDRNVVNKLLKIAEKYKNYKIVKIIW